MLVLALSVSCLGGCGSSESAEKETTSKVETQQIEEPSTETEVESEEDLTEEVAEPELELATVMMQTEDGSAKIEITYNATFYDYFENTSSQGNFCINENDFAFMEKYEWPSAVAGGGEIFFHANYSAQDYHNERVELNGQYGINVTDMEQLTISDKTAYVFKEDFYNDEERLMPYIVFEIDSNVLVFLLPSGDWTNEDFLRDVGEFFVNAKVVE